MKTNIFDDDFWVFFGLKFWISNRIKDFTPPCFSINQFKTILCSHLPCNFVSFVCFFFLSSNSISIVHIRLRLRLRIQVSHKTNLKFKFDFEIYARVWFKTKWKFINFFVDLKSLMSIFFTALVNMSIKHDQIFSCCFTISAVFVKEKGEKLCSKFVC